MGIGSLALSLVTPQTSLWVIEVDLAILGIGLGLNTGPVSSVAVAHVEPERLGTASGLLNTARMIGATLGVAIMGAVFAHLAGQGTPASVTGGLHRAFLIGGGGELLGAAIAFFGVGREALGHRQR
jgi:predicted MFS family arabinose efflux permease